MPSEINNKKSFMAEIRALNEGRSSKAMVTTYGCQQNEADSQRLRGLLREMGYELTEDAAQADVIILNSCAVRAHAEDRVFGNIGALSHYKRARPETVLCLAGCMAAEQNVRERIRKSYPYVDLTFPPDKIWMLPELLYGILTERKRRQVEPESEAPLIEGFQRTGSAGRPRGCQSYTAAITSAHTALCPMSGAASEAALPRP